MSGQVVATLMTIPAAARTAGMIEEAAGRTFFAISVIGRAASVKTLADRCVEAANEQRRREKENLAKWHDHCERTRELMREVAVAESAARASEERLAGVSLAAPGRVHTTPEHEEKHHPSPRPAPDRNENRLAPALVESLLLELAEILAELPPALRAAAGSPVPLLEGQLQRWRHRLAGGDTPDLHEFQGLRDAFRNSLAAFAGELQARRARQALLHERIEAVLDSVLYEEQLVLACPGETACRDEITALRMQLEVMLGTGDAGEGAIALIERRAATLQPEIEQAVVDASWREGLSESLQRNLQEMGYSPVQPFGDAGHPLNIGVLRIPGGELLRAALHKNHQLAFEVVHERTPGADPNAPLTPQEREFLVKQEQQWCGDLHELIRRLVAEGFHYDVSFERVLPEESVRVVLVETADDLLTGEEMESDSGQQRHFE